LKRFFIFQKLHAAGVIHVGATICPDILAV